VLWRTAEQLVLPHYSALEGFHVLHAPDDMTLPRFQFSGEVAILDVNFDSRCVRLPASVSRRLESRVRRSALRAEAIITVSKFSQWKIFWRFKLAGARISVIYNASVLYLYALQARLPALARRYGISGEYIVTFADRSLHRNLATLWRTFAQLHKRASVQLLITVGWLRVIGTRPADACTRT
jgi:glycosyltransferase involved in cell wall biosynthesis